jgi:type IV pilus assembly protein PilW
MKPPFARPHKPMARSRRLLRGLGLLELLVGMAIGLLICLAAMGGLVSTQGAYKTLSDSARLQQDASTLMRVLGHQLRQAGAQGLQAAPGGNVVLALAWTPASSSVPAIVTGTEGGAMGRDTLSVTHRIDPNLDDRDCLGQTPAGHYNKSTFRWLGNELQCMGSASKPSYQGLASGVEDFQVWYGVREGTGLQYRTADAVGPQDLLESLMVCLRLVGEHRGNPLPSTAPAGCREGEVLPLDGRLRRVFRQVFFLRNAAP